MDETLRREVVVSPAFDKRHPDKHPDYGILGAEIRFHLIGEQGAAQFVIYTNWQLPEVTKELDSRLASREFPHLMCRPLPAYVGYHRLTPAYEGQDSLAESCDLLGGRPCYYNGSGLRAQDVYESMLREGDVAIWRELEQVYRESVLSPTEPAD